MALLRVIRPLPGKPTAAELRKLMRQYGITRTRAARLMRCSPSTVDRYLLPETTPGAQPIPLGRYELFAFKLQAVFHPDESLDLQL